MKKTLFFALFAALSLSLLACGDDSSSDPSYQESQLQGTWTCSATVMETLPLSMSLDLASDHTLELNASYTFLVPTTGTATGTWSLEGDTLQLQPVYPDTLATLGLLLGDTLKLPILSLDEYNWNTRFLIPGQDPIPLEFKLVER